MKNTTTAAAPASSFFELSDFEIPITYPFLPGVEMKFFMRMQMNDEATKANQAFLALPKDEREAKDHENNVQLIANLSTRLPENIPTFPTEGDVKQTITDFFSGDNPMKKKLCVDVLNRYFSHIRPKEYL